MLATLPNNHLFERSSFFLDPQWNASCQWPLGPAASPVEDPSFSTTGFSAQHLFNPFTAPPPQVPLPLQHSNADLLRAHAAAALPPLSLSALEPLPPFPPSLLPESLFASSPPSSPQPTFLPLSPSPLVSPTRPALPSIVRASVVGGVGRNFHQLTLDLDLESTESAHHTQENIILPASSSSSPTAARRFRRKRRGSSSSSLSGGSTKSGGAQRPAKKQKKRSVQLYRVDKEDYECQTTHPHALIGPILGRILGKAPPPRSGGVSVRGPNRMPVGTEPAPSSPTASHERSAEWSELEFRGYHLGEPDDEVPLPNPEGRIRVWVNAKQKRYYDCECARRKPVQDLQKIKEHCRRPHVFTDGKP